MDEFKRSITGLYDVVWKPEGGGGGLLFSKLTLNSATDTLLWVKLPPIEIKPIFRTNTFIVPYEEKD